MGCERRCRFVRWLRTSFSLPSLVESTKKKESTVVLRAAKRVADADLVVVKLQERGHHDMVLLLASLYAHHSGIALHISISISPCIDASYPATIAVYTATITTSWVWHETARSELSRDKARPRMTDRGGLRACAEPGSGRYKRWCAWRRPRCQARRGSFTFCLLALDAVTLLTEYNWNRDWN